MNQRIIFAFIFTGLLKLAFGWSWMEVGALWLLIGIGLFVWYALADLWTAISRRLAPTHFHYEQHEHKTVELHPDVTRPYSARVPKNEVEQSGKGK
jgi:ABC-type nickel/cobalt efflux system permease component RcnA